MYNIPSSLSESVSVLPSGTHRPEEYHHYKNKNNNNKNKNSETSYLPSHLIVSSSSSSSSFVRQKSIQPPETKQGRYRINRISKKIASVNVLLTSKLLRRHKRLGPPPPATTTATTTTTHNNTQEQVDTYNHKDEYNVTTSSLPKRTSIVSFQPYSLFGSTTNPEQQINNHHTMNPTTMLVKAAIPGAGGFFNFKGEEKDGVVTKVAPVWVWLFAGATGTYIPTEIGFQKMRRSNVISYILFQRKNCGWNFVTHTFSHSFCFIFQPLLLLLFFIICSNCDCIDKFCILELVCIYMYWFHDCICTICCISKDKNCRTWFLP